MPTKTKKPEQNYEPVTEEKVEMIEDPNNPEDFITFKRTHFYSVLVVLASAVGILVGAAGTRYYSARTMAANPSAPAAAENDAAPSGADVITAPTQPQYIRYDIPTEGYPSLGPDDAPIT